MSGIIKKSTLSTEKGAVNMSSWKESWNSFAGPTKQGIKNIGISISEFIEAAQEGELDKEQVGGCLEKIVAVIAVVVVIWWWGGRLNEDSDSAGTIATPPPVVSSQVLQSDSSAEIKKEQVSENLDLEIIPIIQNGYLGEYTDMTARELLSGHYIPMLYKDETWESRISDSGDKVVEVTYTGNEGGAEDTVIQFTMLDDKCFMITSLQDPFYPVENSSDLWGTLNYFYWEQYNSHHAELASSEEAKEKFRKMLEQTDAFLVQYGASDDYGGDRRKICKIADDLPAEGTVMEVLNQQGLINTDWFYEPPASGNNITEAEIDSMNNYYILPQSNQRLLTYMDIENFSKQDIQLARNEIFARHGRKFADDSIRTYFESQSWYKGTIEPENFSTSVFSSIEQQNIDFLKLYENGLDGVSQQVSGSGTVVTYKGYMIPQSSSRMLTYADIAGLSSWQLSIARNEIYARNGRLFNDQDIQTYFDSQAWYYGYISPEDFTESLLSETEKYNIQFIKSYE